MTQEFTEQLAKWEMHLHQLGYRKVVLCKDCQNHEPEDYCHIRDGLWYDNDFCSSGERKTDNG